MRKLPIGIQSFEKLRQGDYIYIDKTKYIWNLVHDGTVYFLSRPRRFGKSLLLSTMEAYFEGKKELFSGLEIEKSENDSEEPWAKYPVIHISFATGDYRQGDELVKNIEALLFDNYQKFGIEQHTENTLGKRFFDLIKGINEKTGSGVVVLIDEYDKPLLDNLAVDEEQEEKNRGILKGFYGSLKDADKYLKFVFITGVTKFSKVSLFSDLNQLNDISLSEEYAGICGISEEEMESTFTPEISALAKKNNLSYEECIEKLRSNYDGYHFSAGKTGVYNPFSLLKCFFNERFRRYWFATGTPTFLVNMIMKSGRPVEELVNGVSATEDRIENYRADMNDVVPLFYQSGYLSIDGYDDTFDTYKLSFPNHEVEYGFLEAIIPLASPKYEAPDDGFSSERMTGYLNEGDIDSFMIMIKALLASLPYYEGAEPVHEQQWRNIVYAIFKILGQYVRTEVHSARGRSDCIVETKSFIYIFEFKQDKSADEALSQIDEKGYAIPYASSEKKVVKVGANFSTSIRTIDEWKIVEA